MLSEGAIDQRLHRACKHGSKKRASGGGEAAKLYEDPDQRDHLAELLIESKFSKATQEIFCESNFLYACMHIRIMICVVMQAAFKRSVNRYIQKEKARLEETKGGWYAETAMATTLKKSQ